MTVTLLPIAIKSRKLDLDLSMPGKFLQVSKLGSQPVQNSLTLDSKTLTCQKISIRFKMKSLKPHSRRGLPTLGFVLSNRIDEHKIKKIFLLICFESLFMFIFSSRKDLLSSQTFDDFSLSY